jgi:imidazole glycerol-phosphate synthase subunit HisH
VTVAVLDYGSGNLHSVARAIERVGGRPLVTDDPSLVRGASAVVVPGVGHFGACVRALVAGGLDRAIREVAAGGRPVLGVCLGLQVLLDGSDEDGAAGLGILAGRSAKLGAGGGVKVPHMGWNDVEWTGPHPFVDGVPSGTSFYFVHSYAPDVMPAMTIGVTVHGRRFSSAIARDNVFAAQFHPEKSGDAGLAIYEAFVKEARV